jgi:arsenate reductase-like glutaredoxin family protein
MIQVFGTKKCKDTQKALRFFKERSVELQFRDIAEKAPSPGELDDMAKAAGGFEALIDPKGNAATARGLAYMDYDAREELLRDPLLLRTPIVRAGKGIAAVGANETAWKRFAKGLD